MTEQQKTQILSKVLPVVGAVFIVGIALLMRIWPAGWQWTPNQGEYEQMIMGVYATLGIFLVLAGRAPSEHRSLILFTAWSSLVHAAIMAVQAIRDVSERGHLIGDVPALAVVGIVLLALAPKAIAAPGRASVADRGAVGIRAA